ncbi:MAG TPA: hypothetical protein VJK03_01850 [Candidatus Nanoarchaeia archaeon]|nr:hypothetical protein [Candidatus Nanoarchaeia archaeon]
MEQTRNFKGLMFLRNILDPSFIDVITEWKNKDAFMEFIRKNPEQPVFTAPYEVLERYLYETM